MIDLYVEIFRCEVWNAESKQLSQIYFGEDWIIFQRTETCKNEISSSIEQT